MDADDQQPDVLSMVTPDAAMLGRLRSTERDSNPSKLTASSHRTSMTCLAGAYCSYTPFR